MKQSEALCPRLVAVGGSFVRTSRIHADVVGLVLGQLGEMSAQLTQMEGGHLLVQLLGKQVDLVLVLHLRLVLAGLVVRRAELELGKRLVGERVGHDERRVASRAAEVEETALSEHDHSMAIREDVFVALRLDVHAGGRLLKRLHLDLVVEVTDVAHNGVVLHLRHVLDGDDVLVAGGGDEDVGNGDHLLHRDDLITLHASLQSADGVDLGHVRDGGLSGHGGSRALADISKAANDDFLAGKHDVGGAHDAIGERVAAAVHVVELGLGDAVVHVDGREEQLALLRHLDEAVHAGGRLLRHADHAVDEAGEARRVLLDGRLDGCQHALELGVVGGAGVGERLVLGEGSLELLALVEQQRRITSVIDDLIAALTVRPHQGLVGAPPVLLERLPLPREDVGGALAHARGGGVVLRREDVARAPAHVGAECLQRLRQHCRLDGHVERPHHTHARQRHRRAELRTRRHEAGHLVLRQVELLPAEVGEGHVRHLEVARGLDVLEGRGDRVERRDAGEKLPLEQLERRAAAGGDEGDLVLHVELGGGGGGVASANDAFVARRGGLRHRLEHSLGALGEGVELEDAGRAVPDDGLGGEDLLAEELHRLRPAVHALPPVGDATLARGQLGRLVVLELLPAQPVAREDELAPLRLGLLHQLGHELRAVLVEE
mmetsp:Transcript_19328/g.48276  ORF Transcript_19328/g.48276 Transcript_19328/m.48276 type:complete len:662 (+) Transcript_19328:390-2375(+)